MTPAPFMTPAQWESRGQYEELLGQRIFYLDEPARGEALGTIVLIHGFPTASWDWWKLWPSLNERYRLVAVDLLGFGFSAKPSPHDYRITEQADLCEALIEARSLDEFHVLAHDYGDTVAQEMLARQNAGTGHGRWLSCMFLNGGLFSETHRPVLSQRLLNSPLGVIFRHALSRRSLRRSFDHIFGDQTRASDEEIDAFYELFSRDGGKRNLHRLIRYITEREQNRARWVGSLRDARCPIGLINGSVDPVSGEHMVQRFEEIIGSDFFIERLPEIGHYPQVEAPQAVLKAYEQFISLQASAH